MVKTSLSTVLGMLALLLAACDVGKVLRERVRVLTPHEQYAASLRAAGLDSTALGREWLVAGDSALRAAIPMPLPSREAGFFSRAEARAVAYEVRLVPGRRLDVTFEQVEGPAARVFVELFAVTGDTAAPFVHRGTAERDSTGRLVLRAEAEDTSTFLVRLQPELLREGTYELVMRAEPILAFPVSGHGNRAVQSYFGADRDAGRRQHHGIDIFAKRGTPVVASVDGVVRSTRPNNLGGIVVWLSDPVRGQSLYYAHLDSFIVAAGQTVHVGDTLGFVGNTGNARGTRPHLHFGVYRRGRGPVDPWPMVRIPLASPPVIASDTSRLGNVVALGGVSSMLRRWPASNADTVRRLPRATPVHLVGAQAGWFRVQLAGGDVGYLPARDMGQSLAADHPRDVIVARAVQGEARSAPDP